VAAHNSSSSPDSGIAARYLHTCYPLAVSLWTVLRSESRCRLSEATLQEASVWRISHQWLALASVGRKHLEAIVREFVDFRLYEDWAQKYLGPTWGRPMPLPNGAEPMTRHLVLETNDPRFGTLKKLLSQDPSACATVLDYRTYDPAELAEAPLLHFIITDFIDCAGEEYGTVYDDSSACPRCGFGRKQVSPLKLGLSKMPRKSSIATTIARGEEIVVSQALAELIRDKNIAGCDLIPIQQNGRKKGLSSWYQLKITADAGETIPPTRFGRDFLRYDAEPDYICPLHQLSGLNLVSEVFLTQSCCRGADILKTVNRYGDRSGLLMPSAILLISQRFYRLLTERDWHGFKVEVARCEV
jgi:hypothetical protein